MSDVNAPEPTTADDVTTDAEPNEHGRTESEETEYRDAMAKIRGDAKARKEAEAAEQEDDEDELEDDDEDGEGERKRPEKKAEKKPQIEKFKVNGREVEFDMSNVENVRRQIQKGLASDEKFAKASEIERNVSRFIDGLRKNPFATLENSKLGLSKDQLVDACEKWLYDHYEEGKLSPEQKQQRERDRELEDFRKEKKDREQQEKQKRAEELKEQYRNDWSQKFESALKDSGVPITRYTLSQMAMYMRQALHRGRKDIQPKDVVELVRDDFRDAQRDFYSNLSDEQLVAEVGKETADRIRRAELKKFQDERRSQPAERREQSAPRPRRTERTFSSAEEMRDYLSRRRR